MGFLTSVWKPDLFGDGDGNWGAAPSPAKTFLERKVLESKELKY